MWLHSHKTVYRGFFSAQVIKWAKYMASWSYWPSLEWGGRPVREPSVEAVRDSG